MCIAHGLRQLAGVPGSLQRAYFNQPRKRRPSSTLCTLAACRRGVLHGDLSANNILLSSSAKDERGWIAQVGDAGLPFAADYPVAL